MMIRKIIAGIELLITGIPDMEMRESNPVAGIFFASENTPAGDHQIHIAICADQMPVPDAATLLFRAEPLWSIHRDALHYWIVLHPPVLQTPLWVARFNHDFSQGIVYCSEHLKDGRDGKIFLLNPVSYPLDQILLMHFMAPLEGMLIHATGWLYNDQGWMFAGKSGAGKSTLSNLIVTATGSRFLSDDRLIIRKARHEFLMYGTPWPGDAGYAINQSAPLKGLFFLSKGPKNTIRELQPSEAILRLMPVVSIPWYEREKVELLTSFCEALIQKVPMYELAFVPDAAIAEELMRFIT